MPKKKNVQPNVRSLSHRRKVFLHRVSLIKVLDKDHRIDLFCFHIGNRIGTEANETTGTGAEETSFKSQNVFGRNKGAGVFFNGSEREIFFAPLLLYLNVHSITRYLQISNV